MFTVPTIVSYLKTVQTGNLCFKTPQPFPTPQSPFPPNIGEVCSSANIAMLEFRVVENRLGQRGRFGRQLPAAPDTRAPDCPWLVLFAWHRKEGMLCSSCISLGLLHSFTAPCLEATGLVTGWRWSQACRLRL